MANDANAQKAPKTGWFEGLKAEFGKIVWPAKEQLHRCFRCSRSGDHNTGYVYPVRH